MTLLNVCTRFLFLLHLTRLPKDINGGLRNGGLQVAASAIPNGMRDGVDCQAPVLAMLIYVIRHREIVSLGSNVRQRKVMDRFVSRESGENQAPCIHTSPL